jgi:hypothetical protein
MAVLIQFLLTRTCALSVLASIITRSVTVATAFDMLVALPLSSAPRLGLPGHPSWADVMSVGP